MPIIDDQKGKYSSKYQKPGVNTLRKIIINIILIISFIAVIWVNIISIRLFHNLVTANNWVIHTYQTIQLADDILTHITNAETLQQNYLITGDKSYLEKIDGEINALKKSLIDIINFTHHSPTQQIHFKSLSDLITRRVNILFKLAKAKNENQKFTSEKEALFQKGQDLSDQIEESIKEIRNEELALLQKRNTFAIAKANDTTNVLTTANLLNAALLLIGALLINYEHFRRMRAERDRKNLEIQLRSIIEGASDMIAALDTNYCFIIFNQSYQDEFQKILNKEITVGMNIYDIISELPEEKKIFLTLWTETLAGGEYIKNIEIKSHNNTLNTYEITSSLIRDLNNNITGGVHIIRDVTKKIDEQNALKISFSKLNEGMLDLKIRNQKITQLVEMSDVMLACATLEELSRVATTYCEKIIDFASGILYIMHSSKNYLENMASWRNPSPQDPVFTHDNCWGLRLGRYHHARNIKDELICKHIKPNEDMNVSYFCVPLLAQNDIFGLLFLEVKKSDSRKDAILIENEKVIVSAVSEQIALSLANIRLRENLQFQSMHDPLTSLHNRRYLEEFISKEISRARRTALPLTVLMLDLDHFKRFNDSYGHEAGNLILKEVGRLLHEEVRAGDFASRYGGEEFVLVLYNTKLEDAKNRAEQLRKNISLLQVKYGHEQLSSFGVSIGVAAYPTNGETPTDLINSADKALYHAKKLGRNRVVAFSDLPET